jgi:N-methylhydantoinase B
MDAITLELYRYRFAGVAEEMGSVLRRTAFSSNIKDRLDFSCALFDAHGRMIAQAAHIPVHLGAMPACVRAILQTIDDWKPGDVAIVNDPFAGGSHLPDITLAAPVFLDGDSTPQFFVANRAHHADVGGMTPGSLPLSREIYQEGLIVPPLKIVDGGRWNEPLLQLILRNVRTPQERRGDFEAQRAALAVGERRLQENVNAQGREEVLSYARHLLHYTEQRARATIASWPDGVYEAEDFLEWDEHGELQLLPIRVRVEIEDDAIRFDFAGTSPQVENSLNATLPITQAACYYVVRCLLPPEIPANAGCFAPVEVLAPPGTLVNAQSPAAVAGGNVETSQRIVDVLLQALAVAVPRQIPALSQGTMNNLTIGGKYHELPFTYYETIAGGLGATARGNGLSAAHSHMTNTLNTPVEVLESTFPFRVTRYQIRPDSGGPGEYSGGDGLIREYEVLCPVTVTMLSERRHLAPRGLNGGRDGATGRNILLHPDGREEFLPAKFSRRLAAGSRLRIETPGGGGFDKTPDFSGIVFDI